MAAMARYQKLVRDRIPELLDEKGIAYEKRVADDREYAGALVQKLVEEVEEFVTEADIEELADVLEVTDALKELEVYKGVDRIQEAKRQERGGFMKRFILTGEK